MENHWQSSYPAGIPADVNVAKHKSLSEALLYYCEQYADRIAFSSCQTELTYQQLAEQSKQLAAAWQFGGLVKGDRIALMMPNCLQYPIALLAALRMGLVIVNVNPMYRGKELCHILQDADVNTVLVVDAFLPAVQVVAADCDIKKIYVTKLGECVSGIKGRLINFVAKQKAASVDSAAQGQWSGEIKTWAECMACDASLQVTQCHLDDIALLQYTSATTGLAKGAILTHRNILANMSQVKAWVSPLFDVGKEVVVTALPLYHIFSLTVCCFCFMSLGSHAVLVMDGRNIKQLVKILDKEPITVMVGVNTLYNALLSHPKFQYCDFSRLKCCVSGGMATQQPVAKAWKKVTGLPILEGYGLTEASPVVCMNPVMNDHFNGCVGLPIPNTEVCIADKQGLPVTNGKAGELMVRGPQVTSGYWRNAEATKQLLTSDGWLHTGDIAWMDEQGFVKLIDRKKDMIIVSGFNVYPNEIEEVLVSMPNISEAAVIGLPSEKQGESVCAVIVPNGSAPSKKDVQMYCQKHLSAYKIPKSIRVVENLPKSEVGKVLRRQLREVSSS